MTLTEFRKLNATCYISPEFAELGIWMTLKEMSRHVFVESRSFKCERNDHMLHYEQVLDNVFERRESKCCGILKHH